MSDDEFLAEAAAGIHKELSTIADLRDELAREMAKPEPSRRAIGSILHDFYTCCERIFKRIAAETTVELPAATHGTRNYCSA